MLEGGVFHAELIDIGAILDWLSDCEIDDVFLIAVDDLANVVGEGGHHILKRIAFIHQDVMVQSCEALLLEKAQFAALFAIDETIEGVRNMHLRVQRLILLQESSQKF